MVVFVIMTQLANILQIVQSGIRKWLERLKRLYPSASPLKLSKSMYLSEGIMTSCDVIHCIVLH